MAVDIYTTKQNSAARYTTVQGETWDSIAKKLWDEERLMHLLLAENPYQQDVTIFSSGVALNVPTVTAEDLVQSSLPPWKQGVSLG